MPSGSQDPALSDAAWAGVMTPDAGDGAGRRVSPNVMHAAARRWWVDYESTILLLFNTMTMSCYDH